MTPEQLQRINHDADTLEAIGRSEEMPVSRNRLKMLDCADHIRGLLAENKMLRKDLDNREHFYLEESDE